jgi:hypothetical protein
MFNFKIKPLVFAFSISFSSCVFADEKSGFFVIADTGVTKLSAPSTTEYSLSSNSYNLGLGFESGRTSVEFTYGSGFYLSSTYGSSTETFEITNWTLALNYKILNEGNFRPYIGLGRYGGTVNITGQSSENYGRNIYNVGLEIPLDTTSSIRIKYFQSFELSGYGTYSGTSAGLLYRF